MRIARPPGPHGVLLYAGLLASGSPTDYLTRVAARHPRVAHLRLGREHVYVLGHPDLVHELFVVHGRSTRKGRALERIRILLGDGLLTSEGELHRTQRGRIQPAMHGGRVAAYAETMVAAALEHDARWRILSGAGPAAEGTADTPVGGAVDTPVGGPVGATANAPAPATVDMAEEMSGLTLTIVGRALFGSDLRELAKPVAESLGVLLRGFQRHVLPGSDLLLRLPTRRRAGLFAAVDRLDLLVRQLIDQRRAAPPGPDLLSALLTSIDDNSLVRDEVMTLLLAGHETTATALTWTWWLLSEHPEVATWLHEEVDGYDRDDLSSADLERLPRTRAVFAEALRLYPPSWILGRRTLVDLELDGWTLPAGSLCVASQWVLHRDPRFWNAPLEFRPQRWITREGRWDEAAPGQPRAAYLPFGIGSRICVGLAFAWMEGVLVLATLARRWAAQTLPDQVVAVRPAVTLRPRNGIRMSLHQR
ncbi:cytochrome P450 [Actinopolymorpha sp. B17G11]|uniref:cytochrome P450 n=1 Tax=Actinopolymorpha sp. B17G11 TaxID=3160861 RepID=UPI0032E43476